MSEINKEQAKEILRQYKEEGQISSYDYERIMEKLEEGDADSREKQYSEMTGGMHSAMMDVFLGGNGLTIILATPLIAFLGGLIPAWIIFIIFVFSRLSDYITTQIGLSVGAIETNPLSEERELTGFWSRFFSWAAIFGCLTLIAQFVGPHFPISTTFGEASVNINWIQVLVSLPLLGYSLMSYSAAINNTIVGVFASLGIGTRGSTYATTIIASIFLFGLLFGIIAIIGQWGTFTSFLSKKS